MQVPIYWDVKNLTCLLSITYFFSPWQSSSKLALLMTYRKSFILFLAMAKFRQACFAHDLSKKFHTFYTHVIFGCTRHSLNKFGSALVGTKILRSTMPIRNFEFWMLNVGLFAAMHAIENWSIVNWSLRQCWVLNVECWIVGCADVELCAVRNVEFWMLTSNFVLTLHSILLSLIFQ